MASQNNLTAVFTDIANAIRDKKGSVNTIKPVNMADEILTIGDTSFKDLVEGTITNVDDNTITNIKEYSFYKCSELVNINIPNATTIGQYAFYECSSLTTINFPNATSIQTYAFYYCSSLITADFPLLASISSYVFQNCSKLKTLILRVNKICTLSNANAFNDTPIKTSTTEGFIYVPDDLVESYKTATNWSTYASKIKGLSELPTE